MALVLKRLLQGYSWLMDEVADPRAKPLFLMSSPLPLATILIVWFLFVFKWGPEFMKKREPFNLRVIMIMYNICQVWGNLYILCWILAGRNVINWSCAEVDYSVSYWGLVFLEKMHCYFLLKVFDLVDTVFFVLRKKSSHLSFLHVYHHSGMTMIAWIGTKFVPGGMAYFFGLANCTVHTILYLYYLLTAYDSTYSKLLWLKKFITQAQFIQFAYLLYKALLALSVPDCKFPKIVMCFLVPQNLFMVVLFGDFYLRNYILEPKRRNTELKKKMQEPKEESNNVQETKSQ